MQFFLLLALIITTILVLFALQNLTDVTISFLVWNFSGPLAFVLSVIFVLGMFTGISLSIPSFWRKTKEGRILKKRLDEIEKELKGTKERKLRSVSD